jgi:hypothetical protein
MSPHRQQFLRLFEASILADKIHIAIYEPVSENTFKLEEVILIAQTLNSLETILHQEASVTVHMYSSSIILCTMCVYRLIVFTNLQLSTGQLMAFENETKQCLGDEEARGCREIATSSLETIVEIVVKIVEPLGEGSHTIDTKVLPPFITHLVYKSVAVLTLGLQVDSEFPSRSLRQLKALRQFYTPWATDGLVQMGKLIWHH